MKKTLTSPNDISMKSTFTIKSTCSIFFDIDLYHPRSGIFHDFSVQNSSSEVRERHCLRHRSGWGWRCAQCGLLPARAGTPNVDESVPRIIWKVLDTSGHIWTPGIMMMMMMMMILGIMITWNDYNIDIYLENWDCTLDPQKISFRFRFRFFMNRTSINVSQTLKTPKRW